MLKNDYLVPASAPVYVTDCGVYFLTSFMIVFLAGGAAFLMILNLSKLIQIDMKKVVRSNCNQSTCEVERREKLWRALR
jgi:hypothetical protein